MEREIELMVAEGYSIDYIQYALNPDGDPDLDNLIWDIWEGYIAIYE